jgi:hypothetical protein
MASFWYSCISPCVILLYANHRLENIMSGPNLAETKQYRQFFHPSVRGTLEQRPC